jgi:hypothetical protein
MTNSPQSTAPNQQGSNHDPNPLASQPHGVVGPQINMASEIILYVEEAWPYLGYFMAWTTNNETTNNEHIFEHSTTPFLDAARAFIKLGYPPDTFLTMIHHKTGTQSLRAPIGKAAKLEPASNNVGFAPYRTEVPRKLRASSPVRKSP